MAISKNIYKVRERVLSAAKRSGRSAEDILVLAISKTMPADLVAAAFEAGQEHFGENRVQEAREKIPQLPEGMTWHLVGHLQSNKAKFCPGLFQWIHSIDSVSLAREVSRQYLNKGSECRVLVQVNVSGEDAKFGCKPEETGDILQELLDLDAVIPVGLMTMPPFDLDPEEARPHFASLREIQDRLRGQDFPAGSLKELSMGMTGDFEVAIEEGATIVRVGTAIFGPRTV